MGIIEICGRIGIAILPLPEEAMISHETESRLEDRERKAEFLTELSDVLGSLDELLEVSDYVQTRGNSLSDTAYAFYNEARTNIASQNALPVENVSRETVFEHLLDMLRQNDSSVAQAYSRSGHNRQADIAIILQILEHIRPVYDRAREQLHISSPVRSLTPAYEQSIADLRPRLEALGYSFPNLDLNNRGSVQRTLVSIRQALTNVCEEYRSIIGAINPPPPIVTPVPVSEPEPVLVETPVEETPLPHDSWFSLYADLFLHGELFDSMPQTPDALSEWRAALFGDLTLAADIGERLRIGAFFASGHSLGEGWTSRDRDLYTGAFVNYHAGRSMIGGYAAALLLRNIEGALWWSEETLANVGIRSAFFDDLLQVSLSGLFGTSMGMALSLGLHGDVGSRDQVRLAGDFDYVFMDGGTGGDYDMHDIGLSFSVAPLLSRSRYLGAFRFVATLGTNFGLVGNELVEERFVLNLGFSLGDPANLYQPPVGLERF